MENRIVLLFVLVPALTAGVLAQPTPQGVITGQVYDADLSVPIEYANIILYRQRDSSQVNGTVTNVNGRFRLDRVPPGRYYIEVSFIGYNSLRIPDFSVAPSEQKDLGRTRLRQAIVAVQGAEATAERPTLEYKIDKKILDVSKVTTAISGTAVDVLENAPSVKVDVEGNVSLRGSDNFTVLVDGKPTPLDGSEALQQIPAATINQIEIITNPSAKYDPEGVSGIINVIMKKQRRGGISGVASVDGGWPLRAGGSLLLSYRADRLNLFAGGNFRNGRFPGTREAESWTFSDSTGDTTFSSSKGNGTRKHQFYGLRAGGSYQWTGSDRTGFSLRYGGRSFGMNQDATYRRWTLPGTADTSVQASLDTSRHGGGFLSVNLDHVHTFPGREGHQLVADIGYRRMDGDERSTSMLIDSLTGNVIEGRRDEETGPRQPAEVKLDYTLPLREEDKFEAGAASSLRNALSSQKTWEYSPEADSFEFRPEYSLDVNYSELRHAVYAQYAGSFGKVGLQPGFRVEYADRVVDAGDSGRFDFRRWDYFPTLHTSYDLPDGHQVMASYTRRIRRQRGWELWPFLSHQDAYNVRRGNPDLRPEMTDALEAGWQRPFGASRLSAEVYYRVTHDKVERIRSVYSPGVILHTVANVGTDYSLGAEVLADLALAKWWNLNLSTDFYHYRMAGTVGNEEFDNSNLSWEARATTEFRLPTQTRLTLTGRYESPEASAQGTDAARLRTDAALRQSFLNRQLVLTLQVRDLLGTGGFESKTNGTDFFSYFRFTRQSPMLSLNLTWNFNNYRPDRRLPTDNGLEEMDNGTDVEY